MSKIKKITASILATCCLVAVGTGISAALTLVEAEPTNKNVVQVENLFEGTDSIKLQANVKSPSFVTDGYAPMYRATALLTDGCYEYEGTPVRYVPEYHHYGVKANFSAAKQLLKYNNIIDVSKLSKDVPLMDFMPLVQTRGISEATKITVRLEDAYNSDNYLAVVFYEDPAMALRTRVSAYTNEIEQCGYYWGEYGFGEPLDPDGVRTYYTEMSNIANAATAYLPEGATSLDEIVSPYSIRLDPTDYSIILRRQGYYNYFASGTSGITGDTVVLTLTDDKNFGDKIFKGFTNDRAKISITIDSIAAASTNLMIYNINGQPMGGEAILDETAPDLTVYSPKDGVPSAIPNREYKFFDFIATDFVNGNCTDTIYVKAPDSLDFEPQTGDAFVPTMEGEYVIRYESIDGFGNPNVQDFVVKCSWLIEGMTIMYDTPETLTYSVGDTIRIPDYKVVGGSGDIQSNYEVYRVLDGGKVEVKNGKFVANMAGEYRIVYSAEDYLGDKADASCVVSVSSNKVPILSGTLNVPAIFMDGAKIQLPTVEAYDFDSIPGLRTNARLKITVSGNGQEETLPDDRTFTPSLEKFGENIKITYKYYCRNYPDYVGTVKEYDCKIRKATYAQDYFHYEQADYDVSYNASKQESWLRFSLKESKELSTISFVNPVIANAAIVRFSVEKQYQSFAALRFTFTDKDNAEIGFYVDLTKGDKTTSTLRYLDKTYTFAGAFNNDEDKTEVPLGIGFTGGSVVNYNSAKICEVTQNFDGSKFEGFPSGYVKIDISFIDATVDDVEGLDAGITLSRIRKQGFFASYDANGQLIPFADSVRPDVVFDFDSSVSYKIGDVVSIPLALAGDELTPYMDVYVTVSTPNFDTIYNKVLLTAGMTFTVEEYGDYIIEFFATDGAKLKNVSSAVYVSIKDRVSPTITVADGTTIETKVGEVVALPEIVVLDNYSEEISLTVFVVNEEGIYATIAPNDGEELAYSFTALKAGNYRIVFYACDEEFNSSFAEMQIIVKE